MTVIELLRRLYKTIKRVLKVIFGILPGISLGNREAAHREVSNITNENRFSEYQRICSDRSLQKGKRAYMLLLLEQQGIPVLLRVKRFILELVRAIKPTHQLSMVIPLVN